MLRLVFCLDTGDELYFDARTPLEAMNKLIYYLNLSHKDDSAKVELSKTDRTLIVVHCGKTYGCVNR